MDKRDLVVGELLRHPEPAVRYLTRVRALGESESAPAVLHHRKAIPGGAVVRGLLSERSSDGTVPLPVYDAKYRGAHWVLTMLAELGYPAGDRTLRPMLEQALNWLMPHSAGAKTICGRVRRCASQEGNAILYMLKLGHGEDPRCRELVERLIRWQWPGGGWNCDRRSEAHVASFQETVVPLKALATWAARTGDRRAKEAALQAAEMLLERKLFRRKTTGEVIRPVWLKIGWPLYYHYNILHGLRAVAEAGCIGDSRCAEALDLLESKRLKSGWFPAEHRWWRAQQRQEGARGQSTVAWGKVDGKSPNEYVTIDALYVLRLAGRWAEHVPGSAKHPTASTAEAGASPMSASTADHRPGAASGGRA